jgi:DNA helicase HerA-like ATPase
MTLRESAKLAIALGTIFAGPSISEVPPAMGSHGSLTHHDRVLVLGCTNTGKSIYAAELVRSARRVVFFDPQDDYLPCVNERASAAELERYPELLDGTWIRVQVAPREDYLAEDFETTVRAVRAAGDLVFVADELGDYSAEAERTITRLARNGRHDGIALVLVSQAAVDIPKSARRQATRVISFLQTDPDDLAALAKRCGPEFASQVAAWRGGPPAVWQLPTLSRRVTT